MKIEPIDSFTAIKPIEVNPSPLSAYGEMVFKKEGCVKCHSLQIDKDTLTKISLDGYHGMRSSYFLYSLLNDPNQLMASTVMPSFAHLNNNPLSKSNLPTLFGKNKSEELDSIWRLMLTESKVITDEINAYKNKLDNNYVFKNYNSEMIALIAFLNQIPTSDQKLRRDSLESLKLSQELAIWDKLYDNSDSLILKLAGENANIQEGKQIFDINCVVCHGKNGQGEIGPNLCDQYWLHGNTQKELMKTIVFGTENGMPNFKYSLTPDQVGKLVAYLTTIQNSKPKNGKTPQGKKR